ncbi:MAG: alpha/beta fold hydrolase, partial [Maricaulaceae bacterium]
MAKAHSDTFTPPFWLRPAMVQTIIASQKFRRSGVHAMEACAREVILDCGADESTQDCSGEAVRLMGSYSEAPNSKGLLILLHGWEGSQDSTYVMSSGRQAFDNGYSVFRLNFRDHGPTHHLNKALFHSALFNEVYAGVSGAAALANDKPVFVAGFSLGGNFALRVAREQAARPIKNLAHIFAISPVTNPL